MYDIQIYGPPNPALTSILKGPQLENIVWNYTAKVAMTYRAQLEGRRGPERRGKAGHLADTVNPHTISNGGYKRDRWVGEVTVGNAALPYGAADEFGRHSPTIYQRNSTYQGSNDLRTALYSVLPYPA